MFQFYYSARFFFFEITSRKQVQFFQSYERNLKSRSGVLCNNNSNNDDDDDDIKAVLFGEPSASC